MTEDSEGIPEGDSGNIARSREHRRLHERLRSDSSPTGYKGSPTSRQSENSTKIEKRYVFDAGLRKPQCLWDWQYHRLITVSLTCVGPRCK
jgi:hypothetical protein